MNSKEYWQKRGELTQAHLMQKADDFADDMEKAYKAALESIEKDISVFFQRFAKNEGITLTEANKLLKAGELEQFKMTVEEYIQKGIENSVSEKWLKELESASDLYRISRLKALNIQIQQQIELIAAYKEQGLSKTLQEIFEEGYYRNIFDYQQFTGVGSAFATLDTKAINAALSKPWTYDGETFSARIWKDRDKLKYSLEKILTQGIIRGDSPDKTAKLISKEIGTELSASHRLVLTESAAIAERASLESYKELGVDEIEILVTLDEKTCGTCGPLDGRHFPKSDAKAGVNIPPFHPWCRCTTVPYFDDEFTADEQRAARDKDGSTYYVPGNMTYEEWKRKYVDKVNFKPEKYGLKEYTEEEIYKMSVTANDIVAQYTNNKTKWSGKTKVISLDTDVSGGKEWNCDISLDRETSMHIIIHEHLHAHSVSYFKPSDYKKYQNIEEASVELLAKEISLKNGFEVIESGYDENVNRLLQINKELGPL